MLGIIGSGAIGTAIARLSVAAGIDFVLSNSRGPEMLHELIAELGDGASAGTPAEAAAAGDIVVVSVPLTAVDDLPVDALAGKSVLDTTNYYAFRDGCISVLDDEEVTEGEYVQARLGTARLVKAFSSTRLYLADPDTPGERMLEAPAGPVPAAELSAALAAVRRVRVADRGF